MEASEQDKIIEQEKNWLVFNTMCDLASTSGDSDVSLAFRRLIFNTIVCAPKFELPPIENMDGPKNALL